MGGTETQGPPMSHSYLDAELDTEAFSFPLYNIIFLFEPRSRPVEDDLAHEETEGQRER